MAALSAGFFVASSRFTALGHDSWRQGKFSDALEHFRSAKRLEKKGLNDPTGFHERSAWILTWIGATHQKLGDHTKALRKYEKALRIWRALHGNNHEQVTEISDRISEVLRNLGQHAQAANVLLENENFKKIVNESKQADDLFENAALMEEKGKIGEAHKKFLESINLKFDTDTESRIHSIRAKIGQEIVGYDTHVKDGWINRNEGRLFESWVQYQKALTIAHNSLEDQDRVRQCVELINSLSVDKERMLMEVKKYSESAAVHENAGFFKFAVEDHQRALEVEQRIFSRGEPVVFRLLQIALVNEKQNDYKTARSFYQKSIDSMLAIDNVPNAPASKTFQFSQHKNVISKLKSSGAILRSQGNYDEALLYYDMAIRFESEFDKFTTGNKQSYNLPVQVPLAGTLLYTPPQSPAAAQASYTQGILLQQGGISFQGGIQSGSAGVGGPKEQITSVGVAESIQIKADIFKNMASTITGKKDEYFNSSIFHYFEALRIKRSIFKEDNLSIAIVVNNIAGVHYSWEKYGEAEKYYQEARGIKKRLLDSVSGVQSKDRNTLKISMADTLINLSVVLEKQAVTLGWNGRPEKSKDVPNKLEDAHKVLEEALILIRECNSEHQRVPSILKSLGKLQLLLQNPENPGKAIEYFRQCLNLERENNFKNTKAANTRVCLGMAFYQAGLFDQAVVSFGEGLQMQHELCVLAENRRESTENKMQLVKTLSEYQAHVGVALHMLGDYIKSAAAFRCSEFIMSKSTDPLFPNVVQRLQIVL